MQLILSPTPLPDLTAQTSALDARTEAELMRNIDSTLLDKARTSIFIAHRLRTIVESGMHKWCDIYPQIYDVALCRSHYRVARRPCR